VVGNAHKDWQKSLTPLSLALLLLLLLWGGKGKEARTYGPQEMNQLHCTTFCIAAAIDHNHTGICSFSAATVQLL